MDYREDLDNLRCQCGVSGCGGVPGCESPIVLRSHCHLDVPTWVFYFDGVIKIICAECEEEVASIAVARNRESPEMGLL